MPMPLWFGKLNKRVFNPREIRQGIRPVLTHVGRVSGRQYQTPLEAYAVDGGFVFVLMYGSQSDWVKNILASESGVLRFEGSDVAVSNPKLIDEAEAWSLLPADTKRPPPLLRITEYLGVDAD